MADVTFTKARKKIADATIAVSSAVFRALLVRDTSSYTPDPDDEFLGDITITEISASGYARVTLSNVTIEEDTVENLVNLNCDDIVFPATAAGQTFEQLIVYVQVGGDDTTPANDILVACFDFAGATAGGTITATVDADGLISF